MKIAFFSKQLPSDEPNGVSVQVHRLAEALSAKGHSVTVFTFSPPVGHARYKTVWLERRVPSSRIGKKFAAALAFSAADVSSFDIVHYHGDDYLCKGSPRRVRTFYGSAFKEALHAGTAGRFCYQALFYFFEIVSSLRKGYCVAISVAIKHYIPRIRSVLPCGVPLDLYRPDSGKTAAPSILFLGDFASRKRGRILLEIFTKTILPQWPDAVLTVVGPVPCHGEGIVYAGRLDEQQLIREYQRAWVYCMASSYEGFGVPLIEAFACGTAVVAVRTSGSEAIITHEKNGILCTENTLGSSIMKAFSDSVMRKGLENEALKAVRKYDCASIAAQYEQVYQSVLDSNRM